MVFNFNKCLTAALLAISLLSVAYIFESNKTNSFANTSTYGGGEIVSYDMCLIGDTPIYLSFPIISKNKIESISLKALEGGADEYFSTQLNFDPADYITYNNYNIYNFTLTLRNMSSNQKGYSITIPKIALTVNDSEYTYETPDFVICNDKYLSNNGEYIVNSDDLELIDTNTAYYTLPSTDNPAKISISTKQDITLMSLKSSQYFTINDLTVNKTPTDAQNIYMELKKSNSFNMNYTLNYTDYSYSNRIVKSSLIIKYKTNNVLNMFISNTPLYVFPGYSKYYAMERFIDNL